MRIEIRILSAADVGSANVILSEAFGTTHDRSLDVEFVLGLQPDGRFVALADGEPVGTVGAVDFGPFAHVGMMAVLPAWQGRGIGHRLMERLLAWLDARQCPIVTLDATEPGARLYRQYGFEADGQSTRWQAAPAERRPMPDRVRLARAADLTALLEFDAPVFGADRSVVLRKYQALCPDRFLVAEDAAGGIAGYLVARPHALGPWASVRPEAAEWLLSAALTLNFQPPPQVLVPSINADAPPILRQHGFQPESSPHLRMVRGAHASPGRRSLLYGLASFALG